MTQRYLAPAKINVCLHVEGKRADGYHELCMIMQKVTLFDELEFAVTADAGVRLHCDTLSLADGEENLVVRAARAVLAYDLHRRGVKIKLTKNIPVAAGLGGGSSDAATTLLVLNRLLQLDLDAALLHHEALRLGADVPFFMQDKAVWATGIGDQFRSLDIQGEFWIVLVNPGVPLSTAQVYQSLNACNYSRCETTAEIDARMLPGYLKNDLESAALPLCPVIQQVKDGLLAAGAAGALMSGSGATVFGLFFEQDAAFVATQILSRKYAWWVKLVKPWNEKIIW